MTNSPHPFTEHDFRKADASNPNKQCVRVARQGNRVELRDDKVTFGSPDDHRLVFTADEFDAYQRAVRDGIDTTGCCLAVTEHAGLYTFRATVPQPQLHMVLEFTEPEVLAFRDGIIHGEFNQDTTEVALSA